MRLFYGLLFTFLCFDAPASPLRITPMFHSSTSTTATLDFDAELEVSTGGVDEDYLNTYLAPAAAEYQVLYLFGGLAYKSPRGAPKLRYSITNIAVKPKTGAPDVYIVSYHYSGDVQIENGSTSKFVVRLPIRPYEVFSEGMIPGTGTDQYPCTDPHYASSGVFWYFWNPNRPNCPLRKDKNYREFSAQVVRGKNTVTSYPEYSRLVDSQDQLQTHIIFGMNDETLDKNPLKSTDYNAANFRTVRNELYRMGYKGKVWKASEIDKVAAGASPTLHVEEWTKKAADAELTVRLIFTPVSDWIDGYRKFYIRALEEASVVIYNGHSGFGANLDISTLGWVEGRAIQMPQDRYQIVHFNGCSSYPYYVKGYFENKKSATDTNGTQQLDVLANGLMTSFGVMGSNTLSILYAIDNWAERRGRTSYQTLARQIDSSNLFSISGDEDNP